MNYTAACAAEGSFAVIRSIMWAHGRTSKDAGSLGGTSLLLAVKRQKLPCAREHLLINQNYTEFFFFLGGEPDRSLQSPLQGKLKVIFFTCVLTRAVHICAHIPRPDAQPYAPLCFCRSPKPNTNKGSCILKSVGSLTFTWLLCKHLRELHKFQPRGSAPRRAEPYNSLQLKAESKAIGLAQHCAPMDLLFQFPSFAAAQPLREKAHRHLPRAAQGCCSRSPRAARARGLCRLTCTHTAEKPTARNRLCRTHGTVVAPNRSQAAGSTDPGHVGTFWAVRLLVPSR